eukprot:356388-Chlamydomonas_euryale.AAC.7
MSDRQGQDRHDKLESLLDRMETNTRRYLQLFADKVCVGRGGEGALVRLLRCFGAHTMDCNWDCAFSGGDIGQFGCGSSCVEGGARKERVAKKPTVPGVKCSNLDSRATLMLHVPKLWALSQPPCLARPDLHLCYRHAATDELLSTTTRAVGRKLTAPYHTYPSHPTPMPQVDELLPAPTHAAEPDIADILALHRQQRQQDPTSGVSDWT